MAIVFPTSQDSFGSVVDNVDTISASHMNDMRRGVEELEENDLASGWLQSGETWTYASATTFTITGDKTGRYDRSALVRLKQGGAFKYFLVVTATYSAPNTTVTVYPVNGSDVVANAAITDNWFSQAESPLGYSPGAGAFTIRRSNWWYHFLGGNGTQASATTFTVAVDATLTFTPGTKLRCVNGTTKYFYVVSSSYAAPNTTVTVSGGSDYTLAAGAVTDIYLSPNQGTPDGFPEYFNYTPTGMSASNVTLTGRFRLNGRKCEVYMHMAFAGAITFTTMPTLPLTAAAGLTTYDDGDTDLAQAGRGGYLDSGTATVLGTIFPNVPSSATTVTITISTGANMSATVPITWAASDALSLYCEYEV